jgi:CheY-like chemotaxis protein
LKLSLGLIASPLNNTTPPLPPIIAIDDSPDDLFFLQRLLEKAGAKAPLLTFQQATDAVIYLSDAATKAEPGRIPCFIFTDLRMPQMDGLEFLAWIRGEKDLNRLPVIMLTTSDDPKDIAKSKELGVDHYFVKFPAIGDLASLLDAAGIPAKPRA